MTEQSPINVKTITVGIFVAILYTFLGIYMSLKTGLMFMAGVELVGYIILSAIGKYNPRENTIVVSIASGSALLTVGVLVAFPALYIFDSSPGKTVALEILTIPLIMSVILIPGILGILMLLPLRKQFENDPWPTIAPQAKMINTLGSDKKAKGHVLIGLSASGSYNVGLKASEQYLHHRIESIPNAVLPTVPDWIGFSTSPMMGAIGFFAGWKRTFIMVLGAVYSMIIWLIVEGMPLVPFNAHLERPEILYSALGVLIAVMLKDVKLPKKKQKTKEEIQEEEKVKVVEAYTKELIMLEIREILTDPRGYLRRRQGRLPNWIPFVSLTLYTIISMILYSFIKPFPGLEIPWLLILFGSPLALVSAHFTAKSMSETGIIAGYISDAVSIPAILFFHVSFQGIVIFMTTLGGLQDAAIALLGQLKLGSLTRVRGRDIFKATLIGIITGSIVGTVLINMILKEYGFGTTDFPSPAAQLLGFMIMSLQELRDLKLPGMESHPIWYLLLFGIIAGLIARELDKRGWSAMSLAVGLLVPPAYAMIMLIGGIIDYKSQVKDNSEESIKRREKVERIMSGIVAGEGIVIAIIMLSQAIMIMF